MRIVTQKDGNKLDMIVWIKINPKDYFVWYRRFERLFKKFGKEQSEIHRGDKA